MSDEQQIRDLIARWAAAVHEGDLPTVLADHAPDIVMFDVPPPEQGVRGLDAYRGHLAGIFRMAGVRRNLRDRVAGHHVRRGRGVRLRVAALRHARRFRPQPGAAPSAHHRTAQA